MNITTITYFPEADVEFTKEDVDALWKAAESHYDARCRSVIQEPRVVECHIFKKWPEEGLVLAMRNKLALCPGEPCIERLRFSDVDLLCKICESPSMPLELRMGMVAILGTLTQAYRTANQDRR